ncbi:hypothetical protein [Sphingobacterium siyangense]|uniref:hypothetical protein n=1 Tax=Sphingobacterium siyangense TaxID=459529 RepID=UPI003C734E46
MKFLEKVHAIKCCQAKDGEEAMASFVRLTELKHEINAEESIEKLNIQISDWRGESPVVTDELFWHYENLCKRR